LSFQIDPWQPNRPLPRRNGVLIRSARLADITGIGVVRGEPEME
jgi:hypothetical protein